jgi:hypothetical protein
VRGSPTPTRKQNISKHVGYKPKQDGERISIVTWNVADFEQADPEAIAERLLKFDADVISTNEDVEFSPEFSQNELAIPGYTKAVACRGEELWTNMKQYPRGGRYLQNALYVRTDRVKVLSTTSIVISGDKVGDTIRCAAVADVQLLGDSTSSEPIRIASIHLTGGRYTDTSWKNFTGEKTTEIQNLLELSPDIVLGDLNSYRDAFGVMINQAAYDPYTTARGAAEEVGYISYAMEGTMALEDSHYDRLEANNDTTKYGGTVDHIFVREDSGLSFAPHSAIVGNFSLSDHKAVFGVVQLPSHLKSEVAKKMKNWVSIGKMIATKKIAAAARATVKAAAEKKIAAAKAAAMKKIAAAKAAAKKKIAAANATAQAAAAAAPAPAAHA